MKTVTQTKAMLALSSISMSAMVHAQPSAVIGTPRADGTDPKAMVESLNTAFAEFKAKNEESLKAKVEDSVLTEHIERINTAISDVTTMIEDQANKIAAAKIGAGAENQLADTDYSEAFSAHFSKGDVSADLNKGADDEGGYLAPVEWDRTITDKLKIFSPMRRLARVQTIGGAGYKKLYNLGGTDAGWVGETDARPKTNTGLFGQMSYNTGELYAMPAATQQMLDDGEINLETWLADEVQQVFAQKEGAAFFAGDGADKPTGLLTYITGGTNAAKHPFGAITAVSSGDATKVTSDGIIDLIYDLPAEYQQSASFTMNRKTVRDIRKLKDADGNYLWQPTFQAGQPATLAGYSLVEAEDMPDIAADSHPIMFGNFGMGYLIIDRTGTRVLRDPYTAKPYVLFYTTKRVGGGLANPEVLRAMKITA